MVWLPPHLLAKEILVLRAALLLACLAASSYAQPLYRASQIAVGVASATDIASSWGRQELNPVLGQGTFGYRQTGIKLGILGASMVTADRLTFKRRRRLLTVVNFAVAGVMTGVAVRNYRGR